MTSGKQVKILDPVVKPFALKGNTMHDDKRDKDSNADISKVKDY